MQYLLYLIALLAVALAICALEVFRAGREVRKSRGTRIKRWPAEERHRVARKAFTIALSLLIISVEIYVRKVNGWELPTITTLQIIHGMGISAFLFVWIRMSYWDTGLADPRAHRLWAYWGFLPTFLWVFTTGTMLLYQAVEAA